MERVFVSPFYMVIFSLWSIIRPVFFFSGCSILLRFDYYFGRVASQKYRHLFTWFSVFLITFHAVLFFFSFRLSFFDSVSCFRDGIRDMCRFCLFAIFHTKISQLNDNYFSSSLCACTVHCGLHTSHKYYATL